MKKDANDVKKSLRLGINRETIKTLNRDELTIVQGGDSLKTMCMPTLAPTCTGPI
jgi:hypothetical protein